MKAALTLKTNPVHTPIPDNRFIEEVACNLCGSLTSTVAYSGKLERLSNIYRVTDHALGTHYRIVRCRNCQLLYCSPRPTLDELMKFYKKLEDPAYITESEGRIQSAIALVSDLERYVSGGKLLELGSACGFFLKVARDAGFQVAGIEPSEWARKYAMDNFGLALLGDPIQRQDFPDEYFDAVCLFDVVEHFDNPRETFIEIARVTKPGGILYLSTPDAQSWLALLLGRYWWGLQEAHLFYFSRQTIARMLCMTGFETLAVHPFSREFTLAYWRSKLKGYSQVLYRLLAPLAWGPVGRLRLRLSFFDQMLVVARKKEGSHV